MNSRFSRIDFDQAFKAIVLHQTNQEDEKVLQSISLEKDWKWIEHLKVPSFGYLKRSTLVRNLRLTTFLNDSIPTGTASIIETDDDPLFEEEEDVSSSLNSHSQVKSNTVIQTILLNLSICLSPTFQVPVLYFTAHFNSGTPLSLDELLKSNIFHSNLPPPSSPSTITTGISTDSQTISQDNSVLLESNSKDYYPQCTLNSNDIRLPFLSQGEHPSTGMNSWYLHPCETENIVDEILKDSGNNGLLLEEGKQRTREEWIKTWLMVVGTVVDLRN